MPTNKIMPSTLRIFPSSPKMKTNIETAIITGTSNLINCLETTRGVMEADMPRIKRMLNMLLPTTLPRDMSALPDRPAMTLTASSGELVPKATIVSPITRGDIPTSTASFDAPRTNASAPAMSRISPAMKKNNEVRLIFTVYTVSLNEHHLAISDLPVISEGFSIPIRSRSVGEMSAKMPVPGLRLSPFFVTMKGTKFVVWAVCGLPVS